MALLDVAYDLSSATGRTTNSTFCSEFRQATYQGAMGIRSGQKKPSASKLAKRWEKNPTLRSRIRKGLSWLKTRPVLDANGEPTSSVIIATKSLQDNHQILGSVLEEYGLRVQKIDEIQSDAP